MATTCDNTELDQPIDLHFQRSLGKARDCKKTSLARKKRVLERGYIKGKKKHTPQEKKALANKRRVAWGTGGLSKKQQKARAQSGCVGHMPIRPVIEAELVRSGVEQNPGPKEPRQLSCQEKREMTREPLSPEVARAIRVHYTRPQSKVEYYKTLRTAEKEEARDQASEQMQDMGLGDLLLEPEPVCELVAGTSHEVAPAEDCPEPPPPPKVNQCIIDIVDGDFPKEATSEDLATAIRHTRVGNNGATFSLGAGQPTIPPGPCPIDPPPRPPVLHITDQCFEEGDLRGDVLIKNFDRDERLEFAKSQWGPNAKILAATIERYETRGDCRKVSNRGVKMVDKPFEVRHLRVRIGPPLWWAVFLYTGLIFMVVASFYTSTFAYGAWISSFILAAALRLYTTQLSVTRTRSWVCIALSTLIAALPHVVPPFPFSSVLFRILAAVPLLGLPALPFGVRTISYVPHLVACLLGEYRRGTSAEVMMATIHQKTNRMAALPLPDRTPFWTANTVEYGSEQVALFLNTQTDFGRAPSATLPGVAEVGAQ